MSRRHWIAISILGGLVVLQLVILWPQSQPTFQNKPLGYWLRGFDGNSTAIRLQSAEAVECIGTNAIPWLVPRLERKSSSQEPRWIQVLRVWLGKQSVIKIDLPRPASERFETLAAFDALGPTAKDAIPAVEKLLHENPPDPRAVLVLARLGPDAVPVLTTALTNNEKIVRLGSRVCLDMLREHSEILFPKAGSSVEFARRAAEFNLKVLQASFEDYRVTHPEQFLPDGTPRPSLPPDYQPTMTRTNEAKAVLPGV